MRQSNWPMIGCGNRAGHLPSRRGLCTGASGRRQWRSILRSAGVPKLLGRKAKGAMRWSFWPTSACCLGVRLVVRLLMEQPEFVNHWTDVLVDNLRMQREGNRAQPEACFGNPMRANVTTSLASFVRTNAT